MQRGPDPVDSRQSHIPGALHPLLHPVRRRIHHRAVVHYDSSVLPDNETEPLGTRSNYIEQYGEKPDNYEITYIMHNQQPWAGNSDKPCLVTYNPHSPLTIEKSSQSLLQTHCPRHTPRRTACPFVPIHPRQETNVALWRPYPHQQPGDLPGQRSGYR